MKKTIFTLLLSLSCCWLAAQCPTGDVTFSTQGQIDNFQFNYPGCTDMPGSVTIRGDDIVQLSGLIGLHSIGGNLKIGGVVNQSGYQLANASLETLHGLDSLRSIGGNLSLTGNRVLKTLSGVDQIQSIGGGISIIRNHSLTDLLALNHIHTLGGLTIGATCFCPNSMGNNSLTSLEGLENITEIEGDLSISSNPGIKSLAAFSNLSRVTSLNITNMDSLANLNGLENADSIQSVSITDNQQMTSLDGLLHTQSVLSLYLWNNPLLNALGPLQNIQTIPYELSLQNCPLLDLSGFSNLNEIGTLIIQSMPGLMDIGAFENVTKLNELELAFNDDLVNLTGLSPEITYLSSLRLFGNHELKNLTGLKKLASIDRLQIGTTWGIEFGPVGNDSLQDLTGLDNLTSVGDFYLNANPNLVSLNGLEHLDTILWLQIGDHSIGGGYPNNGNNLLDDLSALQNLRYIGHLVITGNDTLSQLDGLDICTIGALTINHNKNLGNCAAYAICNYLANPSGSVEIGDNSPGCNDSEEVEAACMVPAVEGFSDNPLSLIFPNPTTDFLQIQISDPENWDLRLFDLQGRQMFRKSISGIEIIRVKDWPSGIYALRAVSGGRVKTGRVVKQ